MPFFIVSLSSSCYFILNLCFTSKSGTNTVQRRMFTFAYFLRKCFVLTEIRGNSTLKKKSHILLLNYCIVRCFFVILSAIFVYLGHRKQRQNIVYELSKIRCWSAFTNTKFTPQTRTIESVFFLI
jgi:hypothetical protein